MRIIPLLSMFPLLASYARAVNIPVTVFNVPGSAGSAGYGINAAGMITGTWGDSVGIHGFVRDASGNFTKFDPPGSTDTEPTDINAAGTVTGKYFANGDHGFVRDAAGHVTTFDVP